VSSAGRLRRSILIRSAPIAVLVLAVVAMSAYPFDDAFIHLRLARNLAFSGQPYFNLGSPVMSGSSMLWMLWLAAGFRVLGHPSITLAIVTECLVIAGLFVVSEGFLASSERRSWLTLVGAFAVSALALPAAGGLMETPLAVTLLVGGLSAFRSQRFALAGVLLGLSSATRFEMCVPALAALLLAPGWTNRLRFVAGAGSVALALAVLLERFYGLLLPHTMAAKAIVYQVRRPDLLRMGPQEFGTYTGTALAMILCLTTAVGVIRIVGRGLRLPEASQRTALVLGSFPLTLAAIYVWQVPLIFPWYWTLSLCTMALFAGVTVVDTWTRKSAAIGVSVGAAVAIAATLTLVAGSLVSAGAAVSGNLEASPWLAENDRARTYLAIGQTLDHRCPRAVVAAPEIGALGWSFRGRILDGGGLASPEVLPFHPLRVPDERPAGGVGSIPGRAVAALQPDVLVSMELFASDFVNKTKVLPELSSYALWWKEPVLAPDSRLTLPTTVWGTRWTLVFSRHRSAQGVLGCPG
jgi:hypothetical protein